MSEHCVYLLTCTTTGKAYVGLTKVGAKKRFAAHCYNARTGCSSALYAAIRKYGAENFTIEVLADGLGVDRACEMEVALIEARGTKVPGGYNIARGGSRGMAGVTLSAEVRQRMSETHKQRQSDPELRARTSAALKGRPKTPEHVAKVAAALTGKYLSEEHREKVRAANLGKKQSAETIAMRSKKLRGRKVPEHLRNRLGDWSRGRPKSEEHRKKLSEALKGRPLPEETRAKISAATRGRPKSDEWKAKVRAAWARKREEKLRAGG